MMFYSSIENGKIIVELSDKVWRFMAKKKKKYKNLPSSWDFLQRTKARITGLLLVFIIIWPNNL